MPYLKPNPLIYFALTILYRVFFKNILQGVFILGLLIIERAT
jgi:hypothetical protein